MGNLCALNGARHFREMKFCWIRSPIYSITSKAAWRVSPGLCQCQFRRSRACSTRTIFQAADPAPEPALSGATVTLSRNTHNRCGGRAMSLQLHNELCRVAHDGGLAVHLDGARIFQRRNSARCFGGKLRRARRFCHVLSFEGLSCPLGFGTRWLKRVYCPRRQCAEEDRRRNAQAGIISRLRSRWPSKA